MESLKKQAAIAALEYIDDNQTIGIGSGSTVHCFIDALAGIKHRIDACVASSKATETHLRDIGLPVIDLNTASQPSLYIDGADEITQYGEMIKGGGGALTQEKIIASASKHFICIVDESKLVKRLGAFPLAVEVIPMARSFVARELVKLGGDPVYRQGFTTDNGNIILDVHNLEIMTPNALENAITTIPGVVENGIFTNKTADIILIGTPSGINKIVVRE